MQTSATGAPFAYSAFLSYCHEDVRWAKWLQNALESYRVPPRLVGVETAAGRITRRLAPVFRDRSDLRSANDLGASINEALRESGSLIVICSPSASRSRWVNDEISAFQRLGRGARTFCLIVAGEPNASELPGREAEECFAPALRFPADGGAEPRRQRLEPIAADARPSGDGKSDAKLKIIAGLLDVGFDVLKQREQRRRGRRMVWVTVLALLVMLITTGLAIDAVIARRSAELRQKQAENLANFMLGDLTEKLWQVQRLDILEAVNDYAMNYFLSLPARDVTDQTLGQRVKVLQTIGAVRSDQGKLPAAADAYRAAATLAAELLRRAPQDPERQVAYAETLNWVGNADWFRGDLDHALGSFQQAVALLEQATAARPAPQDLATLASARTNAGRVLEARGEFAAAKVLYDAVLATFEALAAREPGNVRWQSERAAAYDSLGKLALEQGQLVQAVAAYRDVHGIATRLAAKEPDNRDLQESLLLSDAILGGALALCGAQDAGARLIREAVSTAQSLVAFDASHTGWQEEFGEYSRVLGGLELGAGRLDTAAALDADAVRVLGELVAKDKTNSTWRRELAAAEIESASLQLAQGELGRAGGLLDAAMAAIAQERSTNPSDRSVRLLEAKAEIGLGEVAARRKDLLAARGHWAQARDSIATVARVGADPKYLAAWASALLLLDAAADARPLVEKLAAIGYRTPDFEALLREKQLPVRPKSAASRCSGDDVAPAPGREFE